MAGAQCGLLPDQVLSLTLPQLKAVIEGYQDHLFDLKCLTAYSGYWAGYYGNVKRPKPLSKILQELLDAHRKNKRKYSPKNAVKPEVDVDAYLEREARFQERLHKRR